jgi:CHAD domain-containing protein
VTSDARPRRVSGALQLTAATDAGAAASGTDAARFAHDVRRDLARRARKLARAARRVREGAAGDAVHDLRVAARRAESALRLWQPLLAPAAARAARRRVRRLRRAYGTIRELELHVALLRSPTRVPAGDAAPAARRRAERLARRFERRRERRLDRVARRVRPKAIRALTRAMTRAGRGLQRRFESAGDPLRPMRSRLEDAERGITASLPGASAADDGFLHRLRLRVKKARYALECLEAAVGVRFGLDRLAELQSVLGEIHDRATLMDEVRARIGRAEARGARKRASALGLLLTSLESESLEWRARLAKRTEPRTSGFEPAPAKPAERQTG